MTRIDDVRAIADPLVVARGFELYDIEQHGPAVRVTVSAPIGVSGPGIADLSAITRDLSRALDEADPIDSRYTLEVSSPGLERSLRTPEHFLRAVGETASVKIRQAGQPAERIRGVITAADDDGVTLAVQADDGTPTGDERRLTHDTIDSARTIFEWGMTPPEKPGQSESPGSTRRSDP